MFASLRCSMDRASPSATHEVLSNVVRAAGTTHGTDGSNPFFSTATNIVPIRATDRMPSTTSLANRATSVDRGNADGDHSREIFYLLTRAPSGPPSGGLPGQDPVTSINAGFAMRDDEGRQIGW